MAVKIKSRKPQLLIEDIKKQIDAGDISTWSYDDEGDFTITSDKWKNKAWFTPYTIELEDAIYFGILGRKDINMTIEEFSVFHGSFVEMLLKHCIYDIKSIEILAPNSNSFDTKHIDY